MWIKGRWTEYHRFSCNSIDTNVQEKERGEMTSELRLELKNCSLEFRQLLAQLRIMEQEKEEGSSNSTYEIDWNHFLQISRFHRVYPLVYLSILQRESLQQIIPEEVLKELQLHYEKNTYRMLQLTAVMDHVCKELNSCGIPSIVLKGPVLADLLYKDLSARTSKDLDVLVPAERIQEAHNILLGLGFRCDDSALPAVISGDVKKWDRTDHHISYSHNKSNVQVELHWRLNPDDDCEPLFDELWGRKQISSVACNPTWVLGNEDLFCYLITHGARHGWFRLRWIVDIERLLRRSLNWDKLLPLLDRYQAKVASGQALILVKELFRVTIPEPLESLMIDERSVILARRALEYIRAETNPDSLRGYSQYLLLLKPDQPKWKSAVRMLYPSLNDARTLALPSSLHGLYFPLRPLLWLVRTWKQQRQRIKRE